jgi:hypothetical protein
MAHAAPRSASASLATCPSTSWCSAAATSAAPRPDAAIEQLADDIAPAHPAAKPHRPPNTGCRRRENRPIRNLRQRVAGKERSTAEEAEAPGQDRAIPCVVRIDGLAEEDRLAESVFRAPPHPLGRFRAFPAREGPVRGGDRAGFFVSAAGREAAAAAGIGLARATRRLSRGSSLGEPEAWLWIKVAPDFSRGHNFVLRQLCGDELPPTDDKAAE